MANIMNAVEFCIRIANDNKHGYDQNHRNGLDYDCSSLVGTALHEAGFKVSPFSWTGNLEAQLRKCGFVNCKSPWQPGDIHLTPGKHVNMSISETHVVNASSNEVGKATGGKPGDQTGKEICVTEYYEPKYGWKLHLRYAGVNAPQKPDISIDTLAREVLAGRWGNGNERRLRLQRAGYDYHAVQTRANELYRVKVIKSDMEIAREVVKGMWGVGDDRKRRLHTAGYNYVTVQNLVNKIIKGDS